VQLNDKITFNPVLRERADYVKHGRYNSLGYTQRLPVSPNNVTLVEICTSCCLMPASVCGLHTFHRSGVPMCQTVRSHIPGNCCFFFTLSVP
jgi:hypothetical protein